MSDSPPGASGSVTVDAPPERVYALLTDLDAMARIVEETETMRWSNGAAAASPGARFRGTNRNGWRRWTTTCTVTDAVAGQRFAFDVTHSVVPIARWQYDIAPTASGCTVTETMWDRRPRWFTGIAGLATGVSDRRAANAEHIRSTLQRLKVRAEGDA